MGEVPEGAEPPPFRVGAASYVVEFARPVGGVLYGSLLTLGYVQTRRASRDSSLGVRIEVEVNTLDPRRSEGEVLGTVGRVLGRLGT